MTSNLQGQEAQPMEMEAQTIVYLDETRKWTIFLSIIGFISLGFMVLGGISYATFAAAISPMIPYYGAIIGVTLIVLAVIYLFPLLYLFRFSTISKQAIVEQNTQKLTLAFKNLKSFFKFIGIFTIIVLSLYAILFIISIVAGGAAALMQ